MELNFALTLLVGMFVGGAAGYLGCFMILKRMALVGDAMTHVALPGMGIAILLGINPFIGALVFLIFASFTVFKIENKTKLPTEALIGIFFTFSLALGILITPETELLEALFGEISKTNIFDGISAIIFAILSFIVIHKIEKNLILGTISEDLAKSTGVNTNRMNLTFLLLVTIIVAIGVKVVGTLLMGALVIIPAVSAKNISKNLSGYTKWGIVFGVISAVLGLVLTKITSLSPGPLVVMSSMLIFVLSLTFRNK